MPARGLAIAAGAALAACSGEALIHLDHPPLGAARAAILAVIEEDGVTAVATDVDPDLSLQLERPGTDLDARLELLLLSDPLEALALSPGTVAAAPAGSGFALPRARAVYVAQISGGRAGGWVPKGEPSAELAAFRTPGTAPTACRPFAIETTTLAAGADYAVPLDDAGGEVLIGHRREMILVVGRELRQMSVSGMPDFVPRAAQRRPGASIFFASDDGRVAYGDISGLDLTLTPALSSSAAPGSRFVDGGLLEDGFEFFVMSKDGVVTRLTPGRPPEVVATLPALIAQAELGGLVRLRSGQAVAGVATSRSIVFTDDPNRSGQATAGVTAIQRVGEMLLVGTSDGHLLRETSRGFEPLGNTGLALGLSAIGPYGEDGVMYAGISGQIGYYTPEDGFCARDADRVRAVAKWIVRRPEHGDWLVTGDKFERAAHLAFVRVE